MWLQPKGFNRTSDAYGNEVKEDTFPCKHCQTLVFVPVRTDPNEFWCNSCMAPICKECKKQEWGRAPDKACSHFERRLAASEASQNLYDFIHGW